MLAMQAMLSLMALAAPTAAPTPKPVDLSTAKHAHCYEIDRATAVELRDAKAFWADPNPKSLWVQKKREGKIRVIDCKKFRTPRQPR